MQSSLIDVQVLNADFIQTIVQIADDGRPLTSSVLLGHHFNILKLFENTVPENITSFQNFHIDWNLGFVQFIANKCVIGTLNKIPGAMFNEALPYVRSSRELLNWAERGAQITGEKEGFIPLMTENPQPCDIMIQNRVMSVIDNGKVLEADVRMKENGKFMRGIKSYKQPAGQAISMGVIYDLLIEKARIESFNHFTRQLSTSPKT